jgi:hypothetical protein
MNERIRELAEQAEMAANCGDHVDVVLMMERFAELIIEDAESEAISLIKYIATDYVELSHDKVQWQRNDYIKLCRKFLDGYRKVNDEK